MALINTSLPNLIQGVSQQPASLRYDGQCEEQENALSSVVDGLAKRPNTRHISRLLTSALDSNSFVQFVDRDDNEQYVIIHDGSALRAYNILSGVEATINGATGGLDITSHAYLNPSNPRQNLKGFTVGDSTFLLNTDKEVTNKSQGEFTVASESAAGYEIVLDSSFVASSLTFPAQAEVLTGANKGTLLKIIGPKPATTDTFLTNTTHTALVAGDRLRLLDCSPLFIRADQAYLYVAQAAYNTTYSYSVTNTAGTTNEVFTTSDTGPISSTAIRDGLYSVSTGSGFASFARTKADTNGLFLSDLDASGQIGIYYTADEVGDQEFSVDTADNLGTLKAVYREVSNITDLPLVCVHNLKVKVKGDSDLEQDDYYVQFRAAAYDYIDRDVAPNPSKTGQGVWEETLADVIPTGLEPNTMPHRLVNTAVNTFTLETIDYADRTVGDLLSSPAPSFVNKKITDIFLFKNRLGLLSDDHVVMSEAGEFFNFYRNTVLTLLDSAPIDVSVASGKVTTLKSAKGFQDNLILFAENGQFALKGGDILTPRTVSINPATSFDYDDGVEPLTLGSYIYFPFTRGDFTGVREYTVNATTDNYDAAEITDHVPAYIPKNIENLTGTTSQDTMVLQSANERDAIYSYNYFWSGNQKVLSAWSKYTLGQDIIGMSFIGSSLYLITVSNNETHLLELPLESGLEDSGGYTTYLDQRISETVLAGNSTITLPYTPAPDASIEVYTHDGLKLQSSFSGSVVTLASAVSEDTDVWVGYPYNMKYTFSEQLFKASAGKSKSPSAAAKLLVRNGSLFFDNTAYFKVSVTPKARNTSVNIFTPDVVGSTTLGALSLDSGFFRFPVFTKAEDTTITIENDSALPSNFQSAEFESFVHSRSNRYG